MTSTSVDITSGRYTRCYDQFKRYFIQAGRSLVFNLPARIYFAKATRGRKERRKEGFPPWRCNFSGWPVRLDPHSLFSLDLSFSLHPHTSLLDEKIIILGERSVMANEIIPLAALSLRSLSLTNFYFAPVSCNTSQLISRFERRLPMEKCIRLSELLNRFVIRLKRLRARNVRF